MNKKLITLNILPIGNIGKIKDIMLHGIPKRRMLDLGMITDTYIKSIMKSPAGDPIAYQIRGTLIALRNEEASQIIVEAI